VTSGAPDQATARAGLPRWALSLSAGALLVLILVQIGRIGSASPAFADLVNQSADYQMLTVHGGLDDILVVVDQRAESVLVYRATQSGVQFFVRKDLKELFFQARQAAGK
jgi:hypothetical protein